MTILTLLASVTIHVGGHVVVAEPKTTGAAIGIVPAGKDHIAALAFDPLAAGSFTLPSDLHYTAVRLPNGKAGIEIELDGWDVEIGDAGTQRKWNHNNNADMTNYKYVLNTSLLSKDNTNIIAGASLPTENGALSATAKARLIMRLDGTVSAGDVTTGFEAFTWSCWPASSDCLVSGNKLTDHVVLYSSYDAKTFTLRRHGTMPHDTSNIVVFAPKPSLELWFHGRAVSGSFPPHGYEPNTAPHVKDLFGLIVSNINFLTRTVKKDGIDLGPVFCPPLIAYY